LCLKVARSAIQQTLAVATEAAGRSGHKRGHLVQMAAYRRIARMASQVANA